MTCLECRRGFHDECDSECSECHPINESNSAHAILTSSVEENVTTVGRPLKESEDIKDRHSTGRKRAAMLYPLFRDRPCEWQKKKNCGGGKKPIVGCISGLQAARHHGPVKDTLVNEPGNVHRICTQCHNRWHTLNDSIYDEEEYRKLPHQPEEATQQDLIDSELFWSTTPSLRVKED